MSLIAYGVFSGILLPAISLAETTNNLCVSFYSVVEKKIFARNWSTEEKKVIEILGVLEANGIPLVSKKIRNIPKEKMELYLAEALESIVGRKLPSGEMIVSEIRKLRRQSEASWNDFILAAAKRYEFDPEPHIDNFDWTFEKAEELVKALKAKGFSLEAKNVENTPVDDPVFAATTKEVLGVSVSGNSLYQWINKNKNYDSWYAFIDDIGKRTGSFSAQTEKKVSNNVTQSDVYDLFEELYRRGFLVNTSTIDAIDDEQLQKIAIETLKKRITKSSLTRAVYESDSKEKGIKPIQKEIARRLEESVETVARTKYDYNDEAMFATLVDYLAAGNLLELDALRKVSRNGFGKFSADKVGKSLSGERFYRKAAPYKNFLQRFARSGKLPAELNATDEEITKVINNLAEADLPITYDEIKIAAPKEVLQIVNSSLGRELTLEQFLNLLYLRDKMDQLEPIYAQVASMRNISSARILKHGLFSLESFEDIIIALRKANLPTSYLAIRNMDPAIFADITEKVTGRRLAPTTFLRYYYETTEGAPLQKLLVNAGKRGSFNPDELPERDEMLIHLFYELYKSTGKLNSSSIREYDRIQITEILKQKFPDCCKKKVSFRTILGWIDESHSFRDAPDMTNYIIKRYSLRSKLRSSPVKLDEEQVDRLIPALLKAGISITRGLSPEQNSKFKQITKKLFGYSFSPDMLYEYATNSLKLQDMAAFRRHLAARLNIAERSMTRLNLYKPDDLLKILKEIDIRFGILNSAEIQRLSKEDLLPIFNKLNLKPTNGGTFISNLHHHYDYGLDELSVLAGVNPNERRAIGFAPFEILTTAMKKQLYEEDTVKNALLRAPAVEYGQAGTDFNNHRISSINPDLAHETTRSQALDEFAGVIEKLPEESIKTYDLLLEYVSKNRELDIQEASKYNAAVQDISVEEAQSRIQELLGFIQSEFSPEILEDLFR